MIRKRSRRAVGWAAAAVGLLAAACDDAPGARPQPPPPAVVVAPVERAEFTPGTQYVGQTVAIDSVDLRARVEAFLERRAFREGQDVTEGALLFELEREPFEAAVEAARAKVSEAHAAVTRTRRDLERAETLAGQGNLSRQSLDAAIFDREQAEASLREGEAELRRAEIDLGYTRITAPFDGRIGRSVYSAGQWVGPESGVLATLVKLDPIYVVFNVNEQQYLDYGQQADAAAPGLRQSKAERLVPRLRLPNGTAYGSPGQLDFVDNRVDAGTGTVAVRATFPNPDKLLLPGLYVSVVLEEPRPKSTLFVPQAAVQEDQGGRWVLVVDADGKAEARRIVTGERVGTRWEVVSGVEEGERVIRDGLQKVRPGMTVAPEVRPGMTGSPSEKPAEAPAG